MNEDDMNSKLIRAALNEMAEISAKKIHDALSNAVGTDQFAAIFSVISQLVPIKELLIESVLEIDLYCQHCDELIRRAINGDDLNKVTKPELFAILSSLCGAFGETINNLKSDKCLECDKKDGCDVHNGEIEDIHARLLLLFDFMFIEVFGEEKSKAFDDLAIERGIESGYDINDLEESRQFVIDKLPDTKRVIDSILKNIVINRGSNGNNDNIAINTHDVIFGVDNLN
jgi:hypothetical protein